MSLLEQLVFCGRFFESYRERDFARTGDIATETVQLYSGSLSKFPHNIEPYLRELGMPTSLQKGVVTLLKDYQVCQKGQSLTSEQARILVCLLFILFCRVSGNFFHTLLWYLRNFSTIRWLSFVLR